ncbi:SPOR domain-containing protein [Helicobacter sp. 23-1045]
MEKREFDDIMLGGDDMRGKDSKKMLLLIIAIVVLVLAIAIIMVMMSNKGSETIVVDNQPQAPIEVPGGDFSPMPIDNSTDISGDRFDEIVRDIKNNTEPESMEQMPSAPIRVETPKATIPPKAPSATTPKVVVSTAPRRTTNRLNNGDIAENGYYLQVGAFSKTPNRAFLDSLNNYSYRIQEIMINSNVITRYLVGPYKSREDAQRDYERVSRDIATKPVYLLVQ